MKKIHNNVYEIEKSFFLKHSQKVTELQDIIKDQNLLILRNDKPLKFFDQLRGYFSSVGKSSLPNYQAITRTSPNFHRMNRLDERSFVKGCFHQFSFFPWNQDVFNLFSCFKEQFYLKNMLSGHSKDSFLNGSDPDFIARIAAQFYPAGEGFLNLHKDPVDRHQLCVPTLMMSQKGKDFFDGGSYFIDQNNKKVFIEDFTNVGDTAYFDANLAHGVDMIDPDIDIPWLDFTGRWMLLLATNKIQTSNAISNSVEV